MANKANCFFRNLIIQTFSFEKVEIHRFDRMEKYSHYVPVISGLEISNETENSRTVKEFRDEFWMESAKSRDW